MCNFDNAIWDRVREYTVLADNFAKFSQNFTMKDHILSTGTKRLAAASPFDPVWGIGLRVDDPEARNPRRWPRERLLGKTLSTVRDAIGTSEAGLATQASSQRFCTPTSTGRIREIFPSAVPRKSSGARLPRSFFGVFGLFF